MLDILEAIFDFLYSFAIMAFWKSVWLAIWGLIILVPVGIIIMLQSESEKRKGW